MGRSRKNYSKLQKELAHEWKKNSASIEEDIHNEIEKETEPYQEIEIGSNIIQIKNIISEIICNIII